MLQDVESFERMRKALHLLKLVAKRDRELVDGKGVSHHGEK